LDGGEAVEDQEVDFRGEEGDVFGCGVAGICGVELGTGIALGGICLGIPFSS